MKIIFEIDDDAQPDSMDVLMDFVGEMVKKRYTTSDLVASMLCAVSAILEADAMEDAEKQ